MSFFDSRSKQNGFVLILLYAVLIAGLSLTSGGEFEPYFPHDDKVMHFCAYLTFSLLCLPFINTRPSLWFCALGIFFYGLLMEIGQFFVPLRDMSFLDVLANTLGMLVGLFLALKLRRNSVLQRFL